MSRLGESEAWKLRATRVTVQRYLRDEMKTDLTERLGIEHPIIQAPMGGANATPPALIAAVSNAGGLGFLGAAYMSPDQIVSECTATRALTSRPFGINLFISAPPPEFPSDVSAAIDRIAPFHAALGIAPPAHPSLPTFSFDEQLDAALQCDAAVVSYTFGVMPADAAERVKSRGKPLIGTATTVEEAIVLEQSGVDA